MRKTGFDFYITLEVAFDVLHEEAVKHDVKTFDVFGDCLDHIDAVGLAMDEVDQVWVFHEDAVDALAQLVEYDARLLVRLDDLADYLNQNLDNQRLKVLDGVLLEQMLGFVRLEDALLPLGGAARLQVLDLSFVCLSPLSEPLFDAWHWQRLLPQEGRQGVELLQ